jgi:hypothetical protein
MKITLTRKIENEVEFPVPSYWKSSYGHVMVTDEQYIKVSDSIIVLYDKEQRLYHIADLMDGLFEKFEQTDEAEFLRAYNKTLEVINQAIQTEQEA